MDAMPFPGASDKASWLGSSERLLETDRSAKHYNDRFLNLRRYFERRVNISMHLCSDEVEAFKGSSLAAIVSH